MTDTPAGAVTFAERRHGSRGDRDAGQHLHPEAPTSPEQSTHPIIGRRLPPLPDLLLERGRVRAFLVFHGELDFIEAVDGLQAWAVESGLVAEIGQDAVQAILADAFEGLLNSINGPADEPFEEFFNDECCPTCGIYPCTNPSFCALCRRLDAGAADAY